MALCWRSREKTSPWALYAIVFQSLSHLDSLWPHGRQHARLPCPSLSPGVCSNLSLQLGLLFQRGGSIEKSMDTHPLSLSLSYFLSHILLFFLKNMKGLFISFFVKIRKYKSISLCIKQIQKSDSILTPLMMKIKNQRKRMW